MSTNDRYLFHLEFAPTTAVKDNAMRSSQFVTGPDLWHCLKALLQLPINVLDSRTALANGHEQYLQRALMIDLHDGAQRMASLTSPNTDGTPHAREVLLGISGPLQDELARKDISPDFHAYSGKDIVYLVLATLSENDQYLDATPTYNRLYTTTLNNIHNPNLPSFLAPYSVHLHGLDFGKAIAVENNIDYQAVSRQFLVESPEKALALLLQVSSAHFDWTAAYETGLPHYYIKAGIFQQMDDGHPLAETVLVNVVRDEWRLLHEKQTGRFLALDDSFLPAIERWGFHPHDLLEMGANRMLRLDEWSPDNGRLTPTESYQQVRAQMAATAMLQPSPAFHSSTVVAYAHPAIQGDRALKLAQQELIQQGDNLIPLVFQQIIEPLSQHDDRTAQRGEGSRRILQSLIFDRHDQIVFAVGKLPAGQGDPDAIYMGIAPGLRDHPSLQGQDFTCLREGSSGGWQEMDGRSYIQIGYFKDGQVFDTPGYYKFCQQCTIAHISQMLQADPSRAIVPPQTQLLHSAYHFQLNWHYHPDNADKAHILSYRMGSHSAQECILALHGVDPWSFAPPADAYAFLPFKLESARIINASSNEVMMEKMLLPNAGLQCGYKGYTEHMDPNFRAAYEKFYIDIRQHKGFMHQNRAGQPPGEDKRRTRPDDPSHSQKKI